jgi:PDZ domain-containing secreted protein
MTNIKYSLNKNIPIKSLTVIIIFSLTIIISYLGFSTKSGWIKQEEGTMFTIRTEYDGEVYSGVESLTVSLVSLNIIQFLILRITDPDYASKINSSIPETGNGMADSVDNSFKAVSNFINKPGNSIFKKNNIPLDEVKLEQIPAKGNSAGLAYSISLLNTLNTENVTNNLKVAATGNIQPDGSVGPVAGLDFKIKLALKNNVDLVFIPRNVLLDYQVYDTEIVEVDGLQEAVDFLCLKKYYHTC